MTSLLFGGRRLSSRPLGPPEIGARRLQIIRDHPLRLVGRPLDQRRQWGCGEAWAAAVWA